METQILFAHPQVAALAVVHEVLLNSLGEASRLSSVDGPRKRFERAAILLLSSFTEVLE